MKFLNVVNILKTGGDTLKNIKKSVSDIAQYIKDTIYELERSISFDEYLEIIGNYTDAKIIEIEKNENLSYVSGICTIHQQNDNSFLDISIDLYFKNSSEQWIKKTIQGKTPTSDFNTETCNTILPSIINEGVKFEVSHPTIK